MIHLEIQLLLVQEVSLHIVINIYYLADSDTQQYTPNQFTYVRSINLNSSVWAISNALLLLVC